MLDRAKPVTAKISNTVSQVGDVAIPTMANVAQKVLEVGKADAPNYKVAAAASMLFLTNTLLSSYQGNYYTSWFNTLCFLGSATTFANQYLSSDACPSVVKNTMLFFKDKAQAVVGGGAEHPKSEVEQTAPILRTRNRFAAS